MTDGDAIFRTVIERPQDDAPRLVYADWLQENGREKDARRLRRRTFWCLRYWGWHEEDVTDFLRREQRAGRVALEHEGNGGAMAAFFPDRESRAKMSKRIEGRWNPRPAIDWPDHNDEDIRHVVPPLRTVARFDLIGPPDDRVYPCVRHFGFGYAHETARYYLTGGNGGCDCNRWRLIHDQGCEVGELPCGHTIRLENLDIRWEV